MWYEKLVLVQVQSAQPGFADHKWPRGSSDMNIAGNDEVVVVDCRTGDTPNPAI